MSKLRSIAIALASLSMLVAAPANAARGVVVAECRSWYLISTTMGYAIVEWYGGNLPMRGQTIVGDFENYGFKDLYNLQADSSIRVWVDEYWLSERKAIEKFSKKCR